ncbi:glycosyltransferase family 4 protein [Cytophagales bacterium LB-30]|uniref:Glycosyltransferase family 4 protein n=1 Tax=Shiella aurantiaca TaxID=3058365 RepID=A0ABT8F3N9_9BACT|nr:glycosyltransferase family 4 protein [Shiella aurantiaca]MDN4164859.1 glycosyltransferase family 4 protein [Shiella aurantiaca]
MNIVLITYQGNLAGSTNSISYLAKGLALKGHKVYMVCRKNVLLNTLLENSPVHMVHLPLKGRLDWESIKALAQLCREKDIQVINAQSSYDRYIAIFAKALFRLKAKVVLTRRQEPKSIGGIQNWFYTFFSDKIVVISEELKKSFVRTGIPARHLKVVYNGIPKERFEQVSQSRIEELKKQYGIKETDVVIGCISRRKKQYQLIRALPLLDASYKVLLAGVNPGEYDALVEELGVKQEIIYAGMVPPSDVLNYYKLLNVNVLCSTTDGFGLVLVESMAMGIPVVATRFGGIINVVKDGVTGLLYEDENVEDLAQKIGTVLNDTQKRESLIKAGVSSAYQEFSMENTVTNYEAFFEELIRK